MKVVTMKAVTKKTKNKTKKIYQWSEDVVKTMEVVPVVKVIVVVNMDGVVNLVNTVV